MLMVCCCLILIASKRFKAAYKNLGVKESKGRKSDMKPRGRLIVNPHAFVLPQVQEEGQAFGCVLFNKQHREDRPATP